jgi:hypothetical protein
MNEILFVEFGNRIFGWAIVLIGFELGMITIILCNGVSSHVCPYLT